MSSPDRRAGLGASGGSRTATAIAGGLQPLGLADAQPTTINRRLTTARLLYRFCFGRELDARGALTPAPYYRGPGRDRQLGLHLLPRRRQLKLRVNVQTRFLTDDTKSYNVLAEIPGTDPALDDAWVVGLRFELSWSSEPG